jgi:hypothetical protein
MEEENIEKNMFFQKVLLNKKILEDLEKVIKLLKHIYY